MVVRILLLLLSLIILVNLCIVTLSYIMKENLYQKYGRQILVTFGGFVLLVVAFYTAVALIGLK